MEKLEYFLYDILGLCVPGFVVLISIEFKLGIIKIIDDILTVVPQDCFELLFFIFLIITCYILGSVLKVLSDIFYKIMQRIFDENINKFTNRKLSGFKTCLKNIIGKDIYEIVAGIFIFKTQDSGSEFEPYYNAIKENEEIKKNTQLDGKEQNKFNYDLYKLAQIVMMNNSIKTHSNLFLAKYYLYKLLASWAFLYILMVIIYYNSFIHPILIIIVLFLCFLTLHKKYKLYKKLNGNELIIALYYFLNYK